MDSIINFNAIRLTTELNKFQRHKTIPTSFFDGTFTIKDLQDAYDSLSKRHQKIADKLISQYSTDIKQSKENLFDSFLNEYKSFLDNQCTRKDHWAFPAVMNKYRSNINPVRALVYDAKDAVKYFNSDNDHHMWLESLLTDKEFNNKLLSCVVRDRNTVDKIINHYHPLFVAGEIALPIEIIHLKQLRQDLLEYANFITKIKNWVPM